METIKLQSQRTGYFDNLRRLEYAALDQSSLTYFDYTGGNICPTSILDTHHQFLKTSIYGNPHSSNAASKNSETFVDEARGRILQFFNAPDYYCVFTANATGALQIVGENYEFQKGSRFLLTADNHNSVSGIREYCSARQGSYEYCPMNNEALSIDEDELNCRLRAGKASANNLFAYPAQSNASGVRHSLHWISEAKQQGWDVLLDASAFVPTAVLDLELYKPDFVCLSFYKMFGYPTGIGCLLINKEAIGKLKKHWFAGGTVTMASVVYNGFVLKSGYEQFENGTINYLGNTRHNRGAELPGTNRCGTNRRADQMAILFVF